MTKKEIEELLRKGAYGALMDDDKAGDEFCEEDIDQILQQRTKVIQIESEGKGSTFAKVSFISVLYCFFIVVRSFGNVYILKRHSSAEKLPYICNIQNSFSCTILSEFIYVKISLEECISKF